MLSTSEPERRLTAGNKIKIIIGRAKLYEGKAWLPTHYRALDEREDKTQYSWVCFRLMWRLCVWRKRPGLLLILQSDLWCLKLFSLSCSIVKYNSTFIKKAKEASQGFWRLPKLLYFKIWSTFEERAKRPKKAVKGYPSFDMGHHEWCGTNGRISVTVKISADATQMKCFIL
jgi:hypothetical protein